jgi:hypothetical protein
MMPALQVNIADPIFIGDFCGFVLALPTALFLSYWISSASIKHSATGVLAAFAGALLGFLIILGWVGTLIYSTPLPGATGASTFFGSLLTCTALGVIACIMTDRFIQRRNTGAYRSVRVRR